MGGVCTKSLNASNKKQANNLDSSNRFKDYEPRIKQTIVVEKEVEVIESSEKPSQPQEQFSLDDFYDGIPRYQSLRSRSSRSAVAKVSEVSSRLSRASIEVLDTLGSSMTNLNTNNGFASNAASKGNELGILAFEVANTIVKGSGLMHSLSSWNIRHLKETVLPSEGVQKLISEDMSELLKIVEADKREELKVFSGEVVRFGNKCKDSQWHDLDRYFEKISRNLHQRQLKQDEAISVMEILMTLAQYTAELYHALQVLDRIEQEYHRKQLVGNNPYAGQRGDSLATLRTEYKNQKKQVRNLKKKSLWSKSLEEVMEKLVDIVNFLLLEIHNVFGSAGPTDDNDAVTSVNNHRRLGPAGLSLHYANIVMQIDTLVARSGSMPPNGRDSLYQNLPPTIKSALRSKLQSFHVKEELTSTEVRDEMEKTLQWLVPMSTNTAKAHHGFGWVGEWAGSGSEANRKSASSAADVIRIDTLYHADRNTTEAYILELVLWLHHLAKKSKSGVNNADKKLPAKTPTSTPVEIVESAPKPRFPNEPLSTTENPAVLHDVSKN